MIRTTSDPTKDFEWNLRVDRDNSKTFFCYNSDGTDKDLTDFTPVINFKVREGDAANFLQLSIGSGLTIVDNGIVAVITKAQAARFRAMTYFVELVITEDSRERNWLTGDAIFRKGKFGGISNSNNSTLYITDVDGEVVAITVADSSQVADASETVKGKIEIATQGETDAGTDDERAVTPLKMKTFVDANIADLVAEALAGLVSYDSELLIGEFSVNIGGLLAVDSVTQLEVTVVAVRETTAADGYSVRIRASVLKDGAALSILGVNESYIAGSGAAAGVTATVTVTGGGSVLTLSIGNIIQSYRTTVQTRFVAVAELP